MKTIYGEGSCAECRWRAISRNGNYSCARGVQYHIRNYQKDWTCSLWRPVKPITRFLKRIKRITSIFGF